MELERNKEERLIIAGITLTIVGVLLLSTLKDVPGILNPGVSRLYNILGPRIAPNQITMVVFDWRGYDTLGECLVLVCGVLATSLIFGRGMLTSLKHHSSLSRSEFGEEVKPTPILDFFTPVIILLLIAFGIYITLGGHITPGGGFQGGSIIAAAVLLSLVVYGREKIIRWEHESRIRWETAGVLIYIGIGIAGLYHSGHFLYNIGADLYEVVGSGISYYFHYPDTTNAGVLPYLNIAVFLKVAAGLSTLFLVLLEVDER